MGTENPWLGKKCLKALQLQTDFRWADSCLQAQLRVAEVKHLKKTMDKDPKKKKHGPKALTLSNLDILEKQQIHLFRPFGYISVSSLTKRMHKLTCLNKIAQAQCSWQSDQHENIYIYGRANCHLPVATLKTLKYIHLHDT